MTPAIVGCIVLAALLVAALLVIAGLLDHIVILRRQRQLAGEQRDQVIAAHCARLRFGPSAPPAVYPPLTKPVVISSLDPARPR